MKTIPMPRTLKEARVGLAALTAQYRELEQRHAEVTQRLALLEASQGACVEPTASLAEAAHDAYRQQLLHEQGRFADIVPKIAERMAYGFARGLRASSSSRRGSAP